MYLIQLTVYRVLNLVELIQITVVYRVLNLVELIQITVVYWVLNLFLPDGYSAQAQDAAMRAMDAQQKAEEAAERIRYIEEQLEADQIRAAQIPQDIAQVNRDIRSAQGQGKPTVTLHCTRVR